MKRDTTYFLGCGVVVCHVSENVFQNIPHNSRVNLNIFRSLSTPKNETF
jgi:hypothetical protein